MTVPHTAHPIATTVHGRYCLRPADGRPLGLLVGFHGYAQTAEIMAAELDRIEGTSAWLTISVQALHRFYTKTGDIVASWMTSQDRELAIADNIAYVGRVLAEVRATRPEAVGLPAVFVGFSQGTAMAYRAALTAGEAGVGVIALGGDIPPEIRATDRRLPRVLIGRGSEEQWYTEAKLQTDVAWLKTTGTPHTVCAYAGGHVWTDEFRAAAARFLAGDGI